MSRNLVLCFDGTGNKFDAINTNVVSLYQRLIRDEVTQFTFYDPGPGTKTSFGETPDVGLFGKVRQTVLGKGAGRGYLENLTDGYKFLMDTYRDGDRVYLFGFSRGAFTARALGGMLCRVGLLQKRNHNLIPYALDLYDKDRNPYLEKEFINTFARPCIPYLIGVWDTVESLGFLTKRQQFTDTRLHPDIPFGFHAISLDERRGKFPVTLWDERNRPAAQTIEQVWFSGNHSNVGGGYPERGLSDIALGWMLDRALSTGLRLKPDWRDGITPDPEGKQHNELSGNMGLWRMLPRKNRTSIFSPKLPRVSVHLAVDERLRRMRTYNTQVPIPDHAVIVSDPVYNAAHNQNTAPQNNVQV